MTNFIFKSTKVDLQKISQQLKWVLDNQRHERNDIAILNGKITKIFNALALQKQVDDYFEKDPFGSAFAESVKQGSSDIEDD